MEDFEEDFEEIDNIDEEDDFGAEFEDEYDLEDDLVAVPAVLSRNEPWRPNRTRAAKKSVNTRAVFTPADLTSVNAKAGSFVFTNAEGQRVQLTKKIIKNNMYWGAL